MDWTLFIMIYQENTHLNVNQIMEYYGNSLRNIQMISYSEIRN